MKTCSIPFLALMSSTLFAEEKIDLKEPRLRTSYAVGANVGTSMKRQDLGLDSKALAAGLVDALSGKPLLSEKDIRETLMAFEKEMNERMEAKQKDSGADNLKKGEAFLAENAKKEGVKSTASGLQYKVVKSGKGATPKSSDTVKVHYHGTLIDGTVFDSSVDRGEPISFPVTGVIPGWVEALQLMKEGDKWQVYIPSKLAYGESGAGEQIGPNSALIFDVELLEVQKTK